MPNLGRGAEKEPGEQRSAGKEAGLAQGTTGKEKTWCSVRAGVGGTATERSIAE